MKSGTDLVVTWQARQDVQEIYHYTLDKWGESQANDYDDMIHRTFLLIRDFPEWGRSSLAADEREYVLTHHIIVYRYDGQTVTILRVAHARQRSLRSDDTP